MLPGLERGKPWSCQTWGEKLRRKQNLEDENEVRRRAGRQYMEVLLEHREPSVSGIQLLEDDIQESGGLRTAAAIQIR